ncbi:aldolase [Candidatus Roizmanbacteria bacterium CG_4_10_14_0_8_um_filter_39_9]|uniref:Aldolase n=1 Tax=Candidatus Roizmanbacteria bacterium CG_4_10_14_0_8_um_filter_39_9 TaxID=1974829 RepID=A0A2M7QD39_9BACT|nr:MAG: aldolase [Candidatus Roizmanbacteria bacterium CG_4_10_14_0_8_um_filter_39_9]
MGGLEGVINSYLTPMDIDQLINTAVFSPDDMEKKTARENVRKIAKEKGIYSASIHALYLAIGQGKVSGFTVPAINIRALTYDTAQVIFKLAREHHIGPFIFEIARSEQGYTEQQPDEYTVAVLAAAIKTGYAGPVFLQGDHYQFKRNVYSETPEKEIEALKGLIKKSVEAGFYNIDIDASTLVDLAKEKVEDQQKTNFEMTALLHDYIRETQPTGVVVSVGGEIGHIGGKNSNADEFRAFMNGFKQSAKVQGGISKVSVQTGTSHGGIPLADGTIAKVKLDFSVLQTVTEAGHSEYKMGGAVQHGASTLPEELFNKFPEVKTLEIHLATGFQNTVYDNLPTVLKNRMYEWIKTNYAKDRKDGQSDEQFIYTMRKKAIGPFKKELWGMTEDEKKPIREALSRQFLSMFTKLNILNTDFLIKPYV